METMFARVLAVWWVVVLVAGFLGNAYFGLTLLKRSEVGGFLMFIGFAIGCAVLCYRTCAARAELRSILKR
jgi:hypothetical protein